MRKKRAASRRAQNLIGTLESREVFWFQLGKLQAAIDEAAAARGVQSLKNLEMAKESFTAEKAWTTSRLTKRKSIEREKEKA